MKKAIHDALGYLWVKNSLEADKKRKEDIAQENARIQVAINSKWDYTYATNYWGTTELAFFCTDQDGYPYRLHWFPKDEFVAILKKDKSADFGGLWWNPKFGSMEDYFTEKELEHMRGSMIPFLERGKRGDLPDLPYEKRKEVVKEIMEGTMPRTEFDNDDRMWR